MTSEKYRMRVIPFQNIFNAENRGDLERLHYKHLNPLKLIKYDGVIAGALDRIAKMIWEYTNNEFDYIVEILAQREGTGKSNLSLELAEKIYTLRKKEFDLEKSVIFNSDSDEYVKELLTYNKKEVIIFDEGYKWFGSRESMKKSRVEFITKILTNRKNGNVIIINAGDENEIDKVFRERRVSLVLYLFDRNKEKGFSYFAILANKAQGIGKDRFGFNKIKKLKLASGDFSGWRKQILKLDTCYGFGISRRVREELRIKYERMKEEYNILGKPRNSINGIFFTSEQWSLIKTLAKKIKLEQIAEALRLDPALFEEEYKKRAKSVPALKLPTESIEEIKKTKEEELYEKINAVLSKPFQK